jgi:glucose-1-phosphate thymidylyltransferase
MDRQPTLTAAAERYGKSPYGEHLRRVAEGRIQYDRSDENAD